MKSIKQFVSFFYSQSGQDESFYSIKKNNSNNKWSASSLCSNKLVHSYKFCLDKSGFVEAGVGQKLQLQFNSNSQTVESDNRTVFSLK